MKKKWKSIIQYIVFLALGIFLVAWSVQKIPSEGWADIRQAFRNANYWLLLPIVASLLLSHYSRAHRWKILMKPMGYTPKTSNTYIAVLVGYLANLAIPRLGEVLKCTLLARYEKIPADKLVGTIVAERAIDVICLLIVTALAFFTQMQVIGNYLRDIVGGIFTSKTSSLSVLNIAIGIGILLILFFTIRWLLKRYANSGPIIKVKKILIGVWQGVTSIRFIKNKTAFFLHTFFIWLLFFLSVRMGMYALQETAGYGIKESLSVLTTGSLAMIVPTPGGGLGVYPLFVQKTLLLYGLRESIGFAFGSLMWSVQFFQMAISGFIALALLPFINKTPVNAKYPASDPKNN